jgi:uncharacterized protein (TIGR02145 family)
MKKYIKLNLLLMFIIFFNLQTFAQISEKLIGEQIWMTSNLNIDKFQNGDLIYEAKTKEQWIRASKEKKPAWCYYPNNVQNGVNYGKLYNWYAVNDPRGLAPIGWHIPSRSEWVELINHLKKDGDDVCQTLKTNTGWKKYEYGGKYVGSECVNCKGTGKSLSRYKNEYVTCWFCNGTGGNRKYVEKRILSGNGTNKSGFAAKPVSSRFDNGDFDKKIGDIAIWWTSTESNSNEKAYSILIYKEDSEPIDVNVYDKGNGSSVRLVKDKSKEILEKERIVQEEQKKKDSSLIIGKSITIGNLMVTEYEFPDYMNWFDAKKACASLGNGWRLPTSDELDILNNNSKLVGVIPQHGYWSSTEATNRDYCWCLTISSSVNFSRWYQSEKNNKNYVRAVRTF